MFQFKIIELKAICFPYVSFNTSSFNIQKIERKIMPSLPTGGFNYLKKIGIWAGADEVGDMFYA